MKKIFYLTLFCFVGIELQGQDEVMIDMNFSASFVRKTDNPDINFNYPNWPVLVNLYLKNATGDTVIIKTISTQTNDISRVEAKVPFPFDEFLLLQKEATMLCYSIVDNSNEPSFTLMGGYPLSSAAKANYTFEAEHAQSFGGNIYHSEPATVRDITDVMPSSGTTLLAQSLDPGTQKGLIRPVDKESFYSRGTAISDVTGEELDVACVGTGEMLPVVFGKDPDGIDEIEYFYTVCIPELLDLLFGIAFIVKGPPEPEVRDAPADHLNAAVYAENIHSESGEALFANGTLRGSTSQGIFGAVAATNGSGNGAGFSGLVDADPPQGGFAYAVTGDTQNRSGAWAAAFNGDGMHTGTWTMSSDARLKTEIRTGDPMLEKIMQLRPSQYRYRQDTPYSLPQGEHYGFLAQELEEIFPQLITKITLPGNLNPETMHTSQTIDYKGINYLEMVSILTASLQELNTKVQTLLAMQDGR